MARRLHEQDFNWETGVRSPKKTSGRSASSQTSTLTPRPTAGRLRHRLTSRLTSACGLGTLTPVRTTADCHLA